MLAKLEINASPFVGIFCCVSDTLAVMPWDISNKTASELARILGVKPVKTTIGGSALIGALLTMNSHGALVTDIITDEELERLKSVIDTEMISDPLNAVGNNVLTNDNGALVHRGFKSSTIELIEDTLNVEVARGTIAKLKTVGTAAIATNRGVLCHPKATVEDIEFMKTLFKVPVSRGTVNFGMGYVGAGALANSKGAVAGPETTGIELGRIEDALDLIED